MNDYFAPRMSEEDINALSMLALAHIGDAVYELLCRTMLCENGGRRNDDLHRRTVALVNAASQAEAAKRIMPALTDDELRVYKRARNAKVNSVPQSADIAQYHAATGLEALFGRLYLEGKTQRINELFALCMGEEV